MNLTHNIRFGSLFPTMTTITFLPESRTCPQCGVRMHVLKTKARLVATLAIGQFFAREYRCYCPRCGFIVGYEELRRLVPQGCNFGFDVVVYVGESFFLASRDNEQIVSSLREKNISVSRSEIDRKSVV